MVNHLGQIAECNFFRHEFSFFRFGFPVSRPRVKRLANYSLHDSAVDLHLINLTGNT